MSRRGRLFVVGWRVGSTVGFAAGLVPLVGRYRADEQRFADLEMDHQRLSKPEITNEPDSSPKDRTLAVTGRAIRGLDPHQCVMVHTSFGRGDRKLVLTASSKCFVVDLERGQVEFELSGDSTSESIFQVALSGDETVIATLGEFTVVKFWDAKTGKLLSSHEDTYPTRAAQKDENPHSRKHSNQLRYCETGSRRLVGAPSGCLFAIGKADGSVELWGDLDHWKAFFRPELAEPRRLGMIARSQLHEGEVRELGFVSGSNKLLTVSGRTVTDYEPLELFQDAPTSWKRQYSETFNGRVVLSDVASLEPVWQTPLSGTPFSLAVSPSSAAIGGPFGTFALGSENGKIVIGDTRTGAITKTLEPPLGAIRTFVGSLTYLEEDGSLVAVQAEYRTGADKVTEQFAALTLWNEHTGQRVATARLPGGVLTADWSPHWQPHHRQMVLVRHISKRGLNLSHLFSWPWEAQPPSPFLLHVLDVKSVARSGP